MGRIICLLGKSGTGKDTLFHLALQDPALALTPLVPYTTRPRRANETEGAQYHFVTAEEMERMEAAGQVVERRSYDTVHGVWHYFTAAARLEPERDYLLITTPFALPAIARYFGRDRVVAALLEAGDQVRLTRYINRESQEAHPNFAEVCRRYLADETDFASLPWDEVEQWLHINADGTPERCLEQFREGLAKLG